jgi:polysaccharide biosynthesis/export protein
VARALGLLCCLSLAACSVSSPRLPTDRTQTRFDVRQPQLEDTPAELLRAFNAEESANYRIGPGDRLTISFWGRPELSGKQTVGPDGYVSLPVVGAIELAGLDREESRARVSAAYGKFYDDPLVTIGIDEYVSNRILVLGRVTNPGALQFVNPPTLLDAIALAGGLPVGGTGSEKATLRRVAVFRGRDRVVWIDLKDLLAGRNLSLNLQLRANDLVYLPDANDQLVYALGEIESPGAYNLSPEMTLLDIVAAAGGLTENANPREITLVRPDQNQSMTVDLRDLLRPNAELNVSLAQGDVLYVPTSGLGKVGYVMRQINPLTSFIIFTRALSGSED